jgi:hypothetical protein
MDVISTEDCIATFTEAVPAADFVCLKSITDANVCAGDYGGPVWATKYSTDGKTLTDQLFFGLTVGSPDIRPNSPCTGGQTIVAMFTPGLVEKWITGVAAGRVVTE